MSLGPRDAVVWCLDPASEPAPERYLALLTDDERRRAEHLKLDRVRREYLLTRMLQRQALSRHAPVDPADWRFEAAPGRRPEIAAPLEHGRLRFSLTHTAGLIACAVARDVAVGVDAENLDASVEVEAVAARFFAPEEVAAILSAAPDRRRDIFLRHWTVKEAWVKALGTGLATPLDGLRLRFGDDGRVNGILGPPPAAAGDAWQFASVRPTDGHVLGLAIKGGHLGAFATRLRWFTA